MKNELKKLIEKINYKKEEKETDKLIGTFNIQKRIGVNTYSNIYFELEQKKGGIELYQDLYNYLVNNKKIKPEDDIFEFLETTDLSEEEYKTILLNSSNEIEFLSNEIQKDVEEAVEDFKNGYLEETEFLEKIEEAIEDLSKINNKIALEIKAILIELLNIENKKIKIKDLKDGEYYFKSAEEIFYISISENDEEEETKFEFTVFKIPEGDNDSASHLFQFIKNGKNYLVNKDFKDWYLREADAVFEENEEIEIIEPDFMDYYEYLKEYEEEEEE